MEARAIRSTDRDLTQKIVAGPLGWTGPINAGRRGVYTQTASKSGVSPDAAGQATGAQLIAKVPGGQFFKPMGGAWTKK